MKFKEIFTEAKKITIKNLPKEIDGGSYDDVATLYSNNKTTGSYEYAQIEPDENGDYGDEGEKYNQGYTLNCDVEIKNNQIYLTTSVTDLGREDHEDFGSKYSNLVFDDVSKFTKQVKKIVKEFDKL